MAGETMRVKCMKSYFSLILCISLICLLVSSFAETAGLTCTVTETPNESEAQLDITMKDLENAGFEPGDILTVKSGNFEKDMPLLNGFNLKAGEYLVSAYPTHTYIELCICYGKFAEETGIRPGDAVMLTMKEKGGARKLQEINNLEYSNRREDYASDEIYANFRAAIPGKLYRSVSPVSNKINRAAVTDRLIQKAGIKTVMNVTDNAEKVPEYFAEESFASPYYRELFESGSVFAMRMSVSIDSDESGEILVKGFTFLSEHEPPYLIHCTEGKDRTGFAVMLLEMMAGFTPEDIAADYMLSYVNFYGIEAGTEKYDMLAENNIPDLVCAITGKNRGEDLNGMNLKETAENYLIAHGMSTEAIETLEAKLK